MKKHFFPKTLHGKMAFTLIIMAMYLGGRELPLYGVDLSAYEALRDSSADLIMQTIGGDRYKTSILALGISPFMFSMLFVQVGVAFKKSGNKTYASPRKITWATLILMLVWASVQAYFTSASIMYVYDGGIQLVIAKIVSSIQMVTGAYVILWMATRNGKYGIGGQTLLIYVNILDSVVSTIRQSQPEELKIIGLVSAAALLITIIFENSEYRIPMQRISIHSIYSDKNYTPIKLNPIGMMPVMFTSAFFVLPVYTFTGLSMLFPNNKNIQWAVENMDTTHPFGIAMYVFMLYLITITFAFIFISPKNLTENMQKTGDGITGLRAGGWTRHHLASRLFLISIFSATVMGFFLAAPLYLQMKGYITATVMNLPSVIIAMGSINCNLYREFIAVRDYDAYVPFI